MILNEFNWLEFVVFLRYQTFPILLNLMFLSVWIPILIFYFIKRESRDNSYLLLSCAFLALFVKEFFLFFLSRRIIFDMDLPRINFSSSEWVLLEAFHFYLFLFFIFKLMQDEISFKGREMSLPLKVFIENKVFSKLALLIFSAFVILKLALGFMGVEAGLFKYDNLILSLAMFGMTVAFHMVYQEFKRDYGFLSSPWYKVEKKKGLSSLMNIFSTLPSFYFFNLIFIILLIYLSMVQIFNINAVAIGVSYEILLEDSLTYIHGLKSVIYFVLLMSMVQYLKIKTNTNRTKQEVQERTLSNMNHYHQILERKKLSYSQPKTLMNIFLDYCMEKFNCEFAIISLDEDVFLKINIKSKFYSFKSWKNESPSLEEKQKFFPYLNVILKEEKKLFIDNFNDKSIEFQEHYPYLMEELLSRDSIRVNSLISVPIRIPGGEKTKPLNGSCVLINRLGNNEEVWKVEDAFSFLKIIFPTLQNLLHYYKDDYKDQIKRRNQMINRKIQDSQNDIIRKMEKRYATELPDPKEGLDLFIDSLYPTKPRYNVVSYFKNKKSYRLSINELNGEVGHLPTAIMMLKSCFHDNSGDVKNVSEEQYRLISLLNEELSIRNAIVHLDSSSKKLMYVTTNHHPIIVYRAKQKKLEIIGSVKDYDFILNKEDVKEEIKDEVVKIDLTELNIDEKNESIEQTVSDVNDLSIVEPYFKAGNINLEKGDMFMLASKDLFKLRNHKREFFDFMKLEKILSKNTKERTATISRRIRQTLDDYSSYIPASHQVFVIGKIT